MPRYRYSTKRAKKGAEGGVALRNVMSILPPGAFCRKTQEELTAAGVDINALTDKSKTLTERLQPLKTVLDDTALFTKLFGRENSNAAMALVQGIDEVNRYTDVISGTNTAFEQAGIIMESYNEKKARIQARFDDFRISVFNATGDFGIWVETVAGSLVPPLAAYAAYYGRRQGYDAGKEYQFRGCVLVSFACGDGSALPVAFHERRTPYRANGIYRIPREHHPGDRRRRSFCNGGAALGYKGSRGVGALLVTGGTASATFAGIAWELLPRSRSRRYRRAGLWVSLL